VKKQEIAGYLCIITHFFMVVGRIEGAGKMSMKYIYYILEA